LLHVKRCPLWVNSRHLQCINPCPLYPRKQTCAVQLGMSALGHTQGIVRRIVRTNASTRCHSRSRWDILMNRKVIVAILLVAAVPVCAHAQKPKVSKADAEKVVTIIRSDKAKTQTYCEIGKLSEQIEQAKDNKIADELSEKIDQLEETLGPEYVALMDGLQDIDPEKDKLGQEIISTLAALGRLCTR